jgi:hypothetical protein
MTAYKLRLDPWSAEYEPAIQLLDSEELPAQIDPTVEQQAWQPVRPGPAPPAIRLAFVDGVRRIEHRLLVENGERTIFGLLGSFAVGATDVNGVAEVRSARVSRVACVGAGLALDPVAALVPNGGPLLMFEPEVVPENTPIAPLQGLQTAMRRAEAALAGMLASEVDIVFLDGPLTFVTSGREPVVGFVKRLLRTYLGAAHAPILRALGVAERTPLFLIQDARAPRFSWYARIAVGRPIDSALTGVVRLETSASLDLARACALADASARELPRFASRSDRDPRAPQNLHPIGALEDRLRHLLGDHLVIRRAIEARLHEEAA